MIEALREDGLELEVPEALTGDRPVGRPHIAQAVLDHPANAERLQREGLADASQVLEAYLVPGAPGYRHRTTPTIAEAIAVIHDAGGLAVWAHPFWDLDDAGEVEDALARFKEIGLDGVEAFYVTHTEEQTRVAAEAARRLGLLATGSADFHGPEHRHFHSFRAFELFGLAPNLGPIANP
jgi:predicted metal-dependent phosphoesterase TrpH